MKIQRSFAHAGLIFIDEDDEGPGIRLKNKDSAVTGNGVLHSPCPERNSARDTHCVEQAATMRAGFFDGATTR